MDINVSVVSMLDFHSKLRLPAVAHSSLPSLFAVFWLDGWVNDRLEDRRGSRGGRPGDVLSLQPAAKEADWIVGSRRRTGDCCVVHWLEVMSYVKNHHYHAHAHIIPHASSNIQDTSGPSYNHKQTLWWRLHFNLRVTGSCSRKNLWQTQYTVLFHGLVLVQHIESEHRSCLWVRTHWNLKTQPTPEKVQVQNKKGMLPGSGKEICNLLAFRSSSLRMRMHLDWNCASAKIDLNVNIHTQGS